MVSTRTAIATLHFVTTVTSSTLRSLPSSRERFHSSSHQIWPAGSNEFAQTGSASSTRTSTPRQQKSLAPRILSFGQSQRSLSNTWSRRAPLSQTRQSASLIVGRATPLDASEMFTANLFAGSLFPWLGFLYLLSRKENGVNALTNFGFQFLLVFVFASIPASLIAMSQYDLSLSDVDWLHGSAEGLLTVTNLLIVAGLRLPTEKEQAQIGQEESTLLSAIRRPLGVFSLAIVLASVMTLFAQNPTQAHDPYLWGVGNLDSSVSSSLNFLHLGVNPEPVNALSLPTWMVHWSSLIEWLVAMRLIWGLSKRTGIEEWKGLTWAMVPLHTSGLCACTYHWFFNAPEVKSLQTLQAATTLGGNILMMIAAYRISVANGWNIKTLLPSTGNHKQIKGEEAYDDDKLSKEEERNSETDTTVSATTVEALGTGGGEGSTWSSVEAELILGCQT